MCFLLNNCENVFDECLITLITKFYTLEQLNSAKKVLLSDLEEILNNKIKLSAHGGTKKDKFSEIKEIMKHIRDNKLDKLIPLYSAINFKNVPKFNLNINETIVTKLNEISTIVHKINIMDRKSVHTKPLAHANELSWDERVSLSEYTYNQEVNKNTTQCKQNENELPSLLDKRTGNDKVLSISTNDDLTSTNDDFTKVMSKRQKRQQKDKNKASTTPHTAKKPRRIIGRLTDQNVDFCAKKTLLRKKLFHISNAKECTVNKLANHLKKHNIHVISIYPIIKPEIRDHIQPNTDLSSIIVSSYRLCIIRSDSNRLLNPNLWPSSVVVQEWISSSKHNQAKTELALNPTPTINSEMDSLSSVSNELIIDTGNNSIITTKSDGRQLPQ